MTKAKLQTSIDESEDNQQSYNASVAKHEKLFDETSGQLRNASSKVEVPEYITVREERPTEGRLNLGVFWPKDIFESIEKQDLPKHAETTYTYGGKKLKGIIRDARFGTPPGTISLSTAESKKVQRVREIENNDRACREGQIDDTWAAASDLMAVGVKRKQPAEEGGEASIGFVQKKKSKADLGNSDDSCDWADVLQAKFPTGDDSPSSGSSDASKKKKSKMKKTSSAIKETTTKTPRKVAKSTASTPPKKSQSSTLSNPTDYNKKKLFPSVQVRTIVLLEQCVAELKTLVDQASSDEGFRNLSSTKLLSLVGKIDAKIGKPEQVEHLTTQNSLRDGGVTQDLGVRGEQALRAAQQLKDQLSSLSSLLGSFSSKLDTGIEATSPFLLRVYNDIKAIGVAVPEQLILHEVVRKHCDSLMHDCNIVGAIDALDASSEVACGVRVFSSLALSGEQLSREQIECSIELLSYSLELPVTSENSDLETLVKELPKTIPTAEIVEIASNIAVVLAPTKHSDQDVNAAIAKLTNTSTTSSSIDERIAKKFSYPRGRALIDYARKFLLQRAMDTGLQAEISALRSQIEQCDFAKSGGSLEMKLVNAQFEAKVVTKVKLRYHAMLAKASDELKASRKGDMEFVAERIDARTFILRSVQMEAFWSTMLEPLRLVAKLLHGAVVTSSEQAKAHEQLQNRLFNLCLTTSKEFGLEAMLGTSSAKEHDSMINDLGECTTAVSEFVRTAEIGETSIFHPEAKTMWTKLFAVGLATPDLTGTKHFDGLAELSRHDLLDELKSAFKELIQHFATKAATFLNQLCRTEAWFALLLTPNSKGKYASWPAEMPSRATGSDDINTDANITHACDIIAGISDWQVNVPPFAIEGQASYSDTLAMNSMLQILEKRLAVYAKITKKNPTTRHNQKQLESMVAFIEKLLENNELPGLAKDIIENEFMELLGKASELYVSSLGNLGAVAEEACGIASDPSLKLGA